MSSLFCRDTGFAFFIQGGPRHPPAQGMSGDHSPSMRSGAHGGYGLRHCSPAQGSLADGVSLRPTAPGSAQSPTDNPAPFGQTGSATPGQAQSSLKNGDCPAEPVPATVLLGKFHLLCLSWHFWDLLIPSHGATRQRSCWFPVANQGRAGRRRAEVNLLGVARAPKSSVPAMGLHLSCRAEALGVHGGSNNMHVQVIYLR